MKSDEYLEAIASEIKSLPPRDSNETDIDIAVKRIPENGICVIRVNVPIKSAMHSDLVLRALNQDENGFHYVADGNVLSVFAQMLAPYEDVRIDQFSDVAAMMIASAKVAQMMLNEVAANG